MYVAKRLLLLQWDFNYDTGTKDDRLVISLSTQVLY